MQNVKISTAGDSSLLLTFGQEISPEINRRISSTVKLIKEQHIEGIVDMIPTYCSLLIDYDPRVMRYEEMRSRMEALVSVDIKLENQPRTVVEIPVCYGGEFGPDMEFICSHAGLSEREVIEIHSAPDYLIYMLGFLPGFTYLGGLDERIHMPRLSNPRLEIPAGSVGIGGAQTGIYPLNSPGGWRLMGRTPVKTYDPSRDNPILLETGQYIRFMPVDRAEFYRIKKLADADEYECVVHREV